ncbi:hypothetical protein [Halorussus sp. AFM4]|uniref:hypothetical protein n=1 Tax=Halorussus sp. AFM4 TaxID=3421651 RepID=UPI003EBE3FC5
MATKLRAFTATSGGFLVVLSLWAIFEYGAQRGVVPFLKVAALGVVVAALPSLYVRARFRLYGMLRRLRLRRKAASGRVGDPDDLRSTFVSTAVIPEPDDALRAVRDFVRGGDAYDGVQREEFPEGDGLTVTHTGFHNSFVRTTDAGRLVVNGTSRKTRQLVADIERTLPVSLEATDTNPFGRSASIRRIPRVLIVLATVVLLVVGVTGVAGAAYQSDAYNSAERGVLVAIDVQSDVDPGMSAAEASIAKAEFVVGVLDEESVEIGWDYNTTSRVVGHGRDAVALAANARTFLDRGRSTGASDETRARVSVVERNLREAEREVAAALDRKAEKIPGPNPRVAQLRERLLAGGEGRAATGG